MITPDEVKSWENLWVDQITSRIDKEIRNNHGEEDYEYAVIFKRISKEDRDSICKLYIEAGWNYAYHKMELTRDKEDYKSFFVFSMERIPEFSQIANVIKGRNIHDNPRYYHIWTELKNPKLLKENHEKELDIIQ